MNCSSTSTVTGRHNPRTSGPPPGTPVSYPALAGEESTLLTAEEQLSDSGSVPEAVTVGSDAILTLARETDGAIDTIWQ